MMDTNNGSNRRLLKRLRWSARIIGIIAMALCLFLLVLMIAEIVTEIHEEGFEGIELEDFFALLLLAIIPAAGSIVSWWRERVGGSILIVSYFLSGFVCTIESLYLGEGFRLCPSIWWIITLPFLVAGVLFLICSRLSRKASFSALPTSPKSQLHSTHPDFTY